MPKFYGLVGYAVSHEKNDPEHPSVWVEELEERPYRGDIYRATKKSEGSDQVIDGVSLNSSISIVADEFAYSNFSTIKYVKWMNAYWHVTSVEVQRPRLVLNVGGVYHGATKET